MRPVRSLSGPDSRTPDARSASCNRSPAAPSRTRTRADRRTAIGVERDRWTIRSAGAEKQIETLKARLAETEQELRGLADVPAMIEEKRGKLLSALSEAELCALLDRRPPSVEIALTGCDPGAEILRRADYITRMEKIAHPYDRGAPARRGIEY